MKTTLLALALVLTSTASIAANKSDSQPTTPGKQVPGQAESVPAVAPATGNGSTTPADQAQTPAGSPEGSAR